MFRKKIINASSNLKRSLHLGTKIKSNEWLDIGTNGVINREIIFEQPLYCNFFDNFSLSYSRYILILFLSFSLSIVLDQWKERK